MGRGSLENPWLQRLGQRLQGGLEFRFGARFLRLFQHIGRVIQDKRELRVLELRPHQLLYRDRRVQLRRIDVVAIDQGLVDIERRIDQVVEHGEGVFVQLQQGKGQLQALQFVERLPQSALGVQQELPGHHHVLPRLHAGDHFRPTSRRQAGPDQTRLKPPLAERNDHMPSLAVFQDRFRRHGDALIGNHLEIHVGIAAGTDMAVRILDDQADLSGAGLGIDGRIDIVHHRPDLAARQVGEGDKRGGFLADEAQVLFRHPDDQPDRGIVLNPGQQHAPLHVAAFAQVQFGHRAAPLGIERH